MIEKIQDFFRICGLLFHIGRITNNMIKSNERPDGNYVFTLNRESIDKDTTVSVISLTKVQAMRNKEVLDVVRSAVEEHNKKFKSKLFNSSD